LGGDVVVLFRRKDHARPRGVSPAPLPWLPERVKVQRMERRLARCERELAQGAR
jgi:hypothetical protein